MCGIIGVIGPLSKPSFETIGSLTSHRGPDNLGKFESEHALLIHNRLSIIDLSEAANQPMISHDQRYVMVFNGEIYNYQELRIELESAGLNFKTNSDSEVLLLGYSHWGAKVLDKLDGMFAFAIWDQQNNKLFCARDHVGIKPLFYSFQNGSFSFSSELKSLENLYSDLTVDRSALAEYLIFNYIPAPKTIYSEVCKLLPGHYIEFDLNTKDSNVECWWTVPKGPLLDISYGEATKLVKEKVGKSVRDQLIADVPVGAFLSGGIDSSIIAAEMAQCQDKAKVFSIGYSDNDEYDETKYAKIVADQFGLDHHIIYPDFKSKSVTDTVELILGQMDEPYGNPTVAMTNVLCTEARNDVVVALVGDGGDEIFGGYPRYRALDLASKLKPIMSVAAPALNYVLRRLPETPRGNHIVRRAKQFVVNQGKPLGDMFQDWTSILSVDEFQNYASSMGQNYLATARQDFLANLFKQFDGSPVSSACYTDQNSFLSYNLLDGADRLSMEASFELRVPFVCRSLVELSAQLKPEWKIKGGTTKRILKDAYQGVLPDNIINRPKRGFNPPVWEWLQNNQIFVSDFLNDKSRVSVLFKTGYLNEIVSSFYARKKDLSSHLWSLIVLEKWLQQRNIVLS